MDDDRIVLGDITFTSHEITRTYLTFMIQSPYAVILHDRDGFRYVNPAGLRLFGVPDLSDIRSRVLTEFICEEKREAVATLLATSSSQTRSPIEARLFNTLEQKVDVEIMATSIVVGGQEVLQVTLRDVSSRNLIEEIRRRQQEWKTIRNFIGHLADKTLNPLTTIEGFLTLLKEGSDEVNIDVLLNEAKSIQQVWSQIIDITQNTDSMGVVKDGFLTQVDSTQE
ncbi:PAS domain-containing protein [Alicyclobacillus sp. ALC3]|uniref:PAS domain-containing protein n=1 Tax=Alicyclobacillus sp. ALC3 TaxID=2796143 RepID=UPI002378C27E|nr:PAS domain-containing protein [Alicyclobacillus sp. ALC3]WDL95919.1 PAS domain-containing protein [Alicyclobacillus sp. ALC3]